MSSTEPPPAEPILEPGPSARRRPPVAPLASVGSVAVAVLALVLDVVAISVASSGENLAATVIAAAAITLSVAAVALAILALAARTLTRRTRRIALAGVVLGLVTNPFLVVSLLTAISTW